eukprot:INCI606.2.p1 GENE.INCI606.2~~INCI606.2.p1  ORF type:complete len:660 (+),score=83.22 INCI606.2:222-2201(+)
MSNAVDAVDSAGIVPSASSSSFITDVTFKPSVSAIRAFQRLVRRQHARKCKAARILQNLWRSQLRNALSTTVDHWRYILRLVRLYPAQTLFLHFSHHTPIENSWKMNGTFKSAKLRIGHSNPFNVPPNLWTFLQYVSELRLDRYVISRPHSDKKGGFRSSSNNENSPNAREQRNGWAPTHSGRRRLSPPMYAALLEKKQHLLNCCEPYFRKTGLFDPCTSRRGRQRPPSAMVVRRRELSAMAHLHFRLSDAEMQRRTFLLKHPTLRSKTMEILNVFLQCTHFPPHTPIVASSRDKAANAAFNDSPPNAMASRTHAQNGTFAVDGIRLSQPAAILARQAQQNQVNVARSDRRQRHLNRPRASHNSMDPEKANVQFRRRKGRQVQLDHLTFVELFARLWRTLTPRCGQFDEREKAEREWRAIFLGGFDSVCSGAFAQQMETRTLCASAAHSLLVQLAWVWAREPTVNSLMAFFDRVLDNITEKIGSDTGKEASSMNLHHESLNKRFSQGKTAVYMWRSVDAIHPLWQAATTSSQSPSVSGSSPQVASSRPSTAANRHSSMSSTRPTTATSRLGERGSTSREHDHRQHMDKRSYGNLSKEPQLDRLHAYTFSRQNADTRKQAAEVYVRHVSEKSHQPGKIFDRLFSDARISRTSRSKQRFRN